MSPIGIMQGRLLPPSGDQIQIFPGDRWHDEFPAARKVGLDFIEWIYDGSGPNPLETPDGIARILSLARRFRVAVRSVCADYFLTNRFLRVDAEETRARHEDFRWLLGRCRQAGIQRIVVPFVDQAKICGRDEVEQVRDLLLTLSKEAMKCEIEVHFESNLRPEDVVSVISELPSRWVKVNYDSGNSAALGYDARRELALYGGHIGSVHIKDRQEGGSTVPLGYGAVDFEAVFRGLYETGYSGDFVLQVARGREGKEVEWAGRNRVFVESWLERIWS